MPRRTQTNSRHSTNPGRGIQPIPLVLEGIRRQFNPPPPRLQNGGHLPDLGPRTRDHHGLGPVHRGNTRTALHPLQQGQHL
ncbi:hypothetical protein, partial [Streptomyces sp. JV190]|uniref:hypothetical protein n=1 Tax=Streptomyces sp. JV190 TaxID=3002533 RepID=UPI002E77847C